MSPTVQVILLVIAAGFAVYLWVRLPQLKAARSGRYLLLFALFLMPLLLAQVGITQSLHNSKARDFCTSCHEMQVYDTSMHIDDPEYLPAAHFQNRRISQETACYTCHTDYTLYGDVAAKLNGMKHVFVHYFGDVPEPGKVKLYSPYPNDNCLQCHRGARRFEKKAAHTTDGVTLEALYSNQKSCVSKGCHDKIHDIANIGSLDLWGTPDFPIPDVLKRAKAEEPAAEDPFAEEPAGGDKKPDAGPSPATELKNVDELWDDDKKPDAASPADAAGAASTDAAAQPSAGDAK